MGHYYCALSRPYCIYVLVAWRGRSFFWMFIPAILLLSEAVESLNVVMCSSKSVGMRITPVFILSEMSESVFTTSSSQVRYRCSRLGSSSFSNDLYDTVNTQRPSLMTNRQHQFRYFLRRALTREKQAQRSDWLFLSPNIILKMPQSPVRTIEVLGAVVKWLKVKGSSWIWGSVTVFMTCPVSREKITILPGFIMNKAGQQVDSSLLQMTESEIRKQGTCSFSLMCIQQWVFLWYFLQMLQQTTRTDLESGSIGCYLTVRTYRLEFQSRVLTAVVLHFLYWKNCYSILVTYFPLYQTTWRPVSFPFLLGFSSKQQAIPYSLLKTCLSNPALSSKRRLYRFLGSSIVFIFVEFCLPGRQKDKSSFNVKVISGLVFSSMQLQMAHDNPESTVIHSTMEKKLIPTMGLVWKSMNSLNWCRSL